MGLLAVLVVAVVVTTAAAAAARHSTSATVEVTTPFANFLAPVLHTNRGDSTAPKIVSTLDWDPTTLWPRNDLDSVVFSAPGRDAAAGIDWGQLPLACPVLQQVCVPFEPGEAAIRVLNPTGAVDVTFTGPQATLFHVNGGGGHGDCVNNACTFRSYDTVYVTAPPRPLDATATAIVTDDLGEIARIPLHVHWASNIPYAAEPPTIAGAAAVGGTLVATPHFDQQWQPVSEFSYLWERCDADGADCASIDSARARTYTPAAPDVGHRLRVIVTGSTDGGSWPSTSDPTAPVAQQPPVPRNLATPSIQGRAIVGATLVANGGRWVSAEPITISYQWQRCSGRRCASLPGATRSRLVVSSTLAGLRLRVLVTVEAAGRTATAVSTPTAAVAKA